jgi:hypothetical protein
MTRHFVRPMAAALACTAFVVACGSATAPGKDCVEAARVYAESLDQDRLAPEGEKSEVVAARRGALAALEARKIKACNE